MFLHLSVILSTGGVCLSACWDTTPLGADSPLEQAHPLGADPLLEQAPHPGAGTPPPSRQPPGTRPPLEQTPPRDHPPSRCLLLQMVCILLECILVPICHHLFTYLHIASQ